MYFDTSIYKTDSNKDLLYSPETLLNNLYQPIWKKESKKLKIYN